MASGYVKSVLTAAVVLLTATTAAVSASAQGDLADLSLDELLSIEITSATRTSEVRVEVPAATTVITREDIRRSPATNVVDLLRTVPGVHVSRLTPTQASVTINAFGGIFANKLLVLVDGRSLYTPLFGGTFWEQEDIPLEEIDRIEIVPGPGGSLWGSNAVNGVINIIKRDAAETQGALIRQTFGNEEQSLTYLRYGGKVGKHGHYRAHTYHAYRDGYALEDGEDARDDWHQHRVGLRYDWDDEAGTKYFVSSSYADVRANGTDYATSFRFPYRWERYQQEKGHLAHVIGRMTHEFNDKHELMVQASVDYADSKLIVIEEERLSAQVEAEHRYTVSEDHEFIWGLGYRVTTDEIGATPQARLDPDSETLHLATVYFQDTRRYLDGRLRLTYGFKLEANEYTGVELQPTLRAGYQVSPRQFVWGAVSRAVRLPTRTERGLTLNAFGLPRILLAFEGTGDFDSEELTAFEIGYRAQSAKKISLELSAYYYLYDNYRTTEIAFPRLNLVPLHIFVPVRAGNSAAPVAYGIVGSIDYRPHPDWWLRFTASLGDVDADFDSILDPESRSFEQDTPQVSASLTSHWIVTPKLELDATLRYVGELETLDVDDYVELDLRLGYRPRPNLTLEIVGANLLQSQHREFESSFTNVQGSEVERSIFGRITWEF